MRAVDYNYLISKLKLWGGSKPQEFLKGILTQGSKNKSKRVKSIFICTGNLEKEKSDLKCL